MVARKRAYLSLEVSQRLDVLSSAEWERLFPDFPDSLEMIQHIQAVGIAQFSFHSLLVRDEGRPILMLPLFETRYKVHSGYQGFGKNILNRIANCLPKLFHPRILGIGFVEGEWGQVGWDNAVSADKLREAWSLALEALHSMQHGLNIDLIAFIDFNENSGAMIPMQKLKNYAKIASNPCGVVPIQYKNLQGYLDSLSKGMRKNLQRKMKKAEQISVVQTTDPAIWIDDIYDFYKQTVERSDTSFGVQTAEYFRTICEKVPGAQYTLYFTNEKLIAFNLLIWTQDKLVDKYFGMHPVVGREFNLYFVSWLENIQTCIRHQIPLYHAGPASEGLKSRLAAQFIPAVILFKHRNPMAQKLLTLLAPYMGYEPEIELPVAQLGGFWDKLDTTPISIPEIPIYLNELEESTTVLA
jgi:hypothetical protein